MVQEAQQVLNKWTQEISELRNRYPWLLYFSIPKVFRLFHLICSSDAQKEDKIVHQVSYLAINLPAGRKKLKDSVKVRRLLLFWLLTCIFSVYMQLALKIESLNGNSCMEKVGEFLNILFNDHTFPTSFSVMRGDFNDLHGVGTYLVHPLYSCPAYSQVDVIYLMLHVFSGIPEAYQVLNCKATTTVEELGLFLRRVEMYHTQYIMFNINKLPFKLQEVRICMHQLFKIL